jgi:paxillin
LGSEWHANCFCCLVSGLRLSNGIESQFCEIISADYVLLQECGGEFEDGRYFLRGESDDPVCVKCEERRLKA